MVKQALAQRSQWERASEHRVVARDPTGLVEVELEARTYRFSMPPRVSRAEADAETVARATLEACNQALADLNVYWSAQHDELSG